MNDQWDCVLNDREELGDQRISCPDESVQYWNLFLLPPPPAILLFHVSSDICRECSNLFRRSSLFSRIRSLPLLLEVILHAEEVFSLCATGYAWLNWAPGSISVHLLSRIGTVLVHEQAEVGLLVFCFSLWLACKKANTSVFNANVYIFVSVVSCSLSSYSLSIKSVTNLFKPWEILTHEWELSLLTDSNLISTSYLPCR